MTAHELLENAAKYASDGKARLEVDVSPRGEDAVVRVVVTNNSTPEHIDQLGTCYAEMNAETDAMAHYFTLMRRERQASASVSRLGLARVRAEGEMDIEVDITGDDRQSCGVGHRRPPLTTFPASTHVRTIGVP